MKHNMHVRLALLALGCLIFGVEARHGGCGCGCGAASARLVPGPRGPVGPTGPCCLTGSAGASIYAFFYNQTLYTNASTTAFTAIPLTQSVAVGNIAITSDNKHFTVPVTGYYKVSFTIQAEMNLTAAITDCGGAASLIDNNNNPVPYSVITFYRSAALADSAFLTWASESIVRLTSGISYGLGGQAAYANNPLTIPATAGVAPNVQLTVEYLGS